MKNLSRAPTLISPDAAFMNGFRFGKFSKPAIIDYAFSAEELISISFDICLLKKQKKHLFKKRFFEILTLLPASIAFAFPLPSMKSVLHVFCLF
jgi:hypothetical protein